METTDLSSPLDIRRGIASRARSARLAANLSQAGMAERAGVSLGSLKRFESTGAASLNAVVRIAFALRMEEPFEKLFVPPRFTSMAEVLALSKRRRRGMGK